MSIGIVLPALLAALAALVRPAPIGAWRRRWRPG